jgi:hypothetical protein
MGWAGRILSMMPWRRFWVGPKAQWSGPGVLQDAGRDTITKERFLTVRWNNILSLGLGLPALVYAIAVLSTDLLSDMAGFIGLVVIGVLY